jgi:3-dehydroquinate dehydratase-2
MKRILIIHGPNLQLLGTREPGIYGTVTLASINAQLRARAKKLKIGVTILQSNHEGAIVEAIGRARIRYQGIVINPAAYTHTSVAIRDALAAIGIPVIEVHLSNIHAREEFRKNSLISPVAKGTIMGFGPKSYLLGLDILSDILQRT